MTPEIMWSLLVALGAIAIAAVLQAVADSRRLHLANEELSSSRKQLDSIKQQHEQSISDLKEIHNTEIEKLSKQIPHVIHGERLEDLREKILILVAQHERLHDGKVAELADITKPLATLHLHELKAVKFVRSSFGLDENDYGVDVWSIEQPGRKYLSSHGLL